MLSVVDLCLQHMYRMRRDGGVRRLVAAKPTLHLAAMGWRRWATLCPALVFSVGQSNSRIDDRAWDLFPAAWGWVARPGSGVRTVKTWRSRLSTQPMQHAASTPRP